MKLESTTQSIVFHVAIPATELTDLIASVRIRRNRMLRNSREWTRIDALLDNLLAIRRARLADTPEIEAEEDDEDEEEHRD